MILMPKKYVAHNSLLPIYLAWQLEPHTGNYNLCFSYKLKEGKDVNLLIAKTQELIKLKAHLRQTFVLQKGKLIVHIHNELPAEVDFFTCTTAEFPALEKTLIKQAHDVNVKSAIKVNVLNFSDCSDFVVLFNIHHILLDGYSLDTFILGLNQLINDEKIVTENALQYILKVKRERNLPEKRNTPGFNAYLNQVQAIAKTVDSCLINNKVPVIHVTEVLPEYLLQQLSSFARTFSLSLFNLLLLAWGLFVANLFNQKYALVSYPVNIRSDKSIDGCFINLVTQPLSLEQDDTYASLIGVANQNMKMFKQVARTKLSDKLDLSTIPNFSYSSLVKPLDLVIEDRYFAAKTYPQIANSNISLKYREFGGELHFSCDILSDLFPEPLGASLLSRFFNYLDQLLAKPDTSITRFALTFTEEKQKLLYAFNDTDVAFPHTKTIDQLFEAQVEKTPLATALVFEAQELTYQELNQRANRLARCIRKKYQQEIKQEFVPNTLVAMFIERSVEMIIGILGIIKAGGAYVPIDPHYPAERIAFILKDTNSQLILTQSALQKNLSEVSGTIKQIILDENNASNEEDQNLSSHNCADDLMYVIYTSGTTGKPKGVMVEHRSVVNVLFSLYEVYQLEENPRATAYTNYVFDVSVAEIFTVLTQGGELHLLGKERKNIKQLSAYLNKKEINTAYLPPAILAILPRVDYPALNTLIFAGEPCAQEVGRYWLKRCKLYNYYGPTETTIYSTGKRVSSRNINEIGNPIRNTRTYVLDSNLNPVPVGMKGELYIAGIGVARGYLHQEGLTQERFIKNIFATAKDAKKGYLRLYKTGDLVRWLEDGNLEYIGRNDFQVKLRGYRIELGEIENILSTYPEIKQAVVLLQDKEGDKHLIAYYLADKKLNEESLMEHLSQNLPDYMLPSGLVYLQKLPLTLNGKLDRRALPIPKFVNAAHYQPPRNKQEQLICNAFVKTLDLERVGIQDDFFRIGGNSIKAIALVSELQDNFDITITDIFNHKTPWQIAEHIPFEKNTFHQRLEQIKQSYQAKISPALERKFANKLAEYSQAIDNLPDAYQPKLIINILLTGATGYLGCNLLNQLLELTDYNIFLLVRAESDQAAFKRLNQKFQFYFGQTLDGLAGLRVFVFRADLEKSDLGLLPKNYQTLVTKVDSIIHAAALTKHYGEYDKFYAANVQATINLLELAKLTELKDFHYISTASVLIDGADPDSNHCVFTEDDSAESLHESLNVYVKTKCEGEKQVIKYRSKGVASNIYRVGNLAFSLNNGQIQENIEDNGFFNRLKCLINLGVIAKEIAQEEISPVDQTAQAIVKIFDKQELANNTYHVFNPHAVNLAELMVEDKFISMKILAINEFVDVILKCLDNLSQAELVERFLLHQGWLNDWDLRSREVQVFQERTGVILRSLGFEWSSITKSVFHKYLENMIKK